MCFLNHVDIWFDNNYEEYPKRLLHIAYGILHHPELSEDIVQRAFLIMLAKYKSLEDSEHIYGWLCRVVKKLIMTETQKAHYTREVAFAPGFDPPALEPEETAFMEMLPVGLSKEEGEILYLHIEAGFSHKEIGALLDCSETAARMRYSRAKRHCRELMEKEKNISKTVSRFQSHNKYKIQEV